MKSIIYDLLSWVIGGIGGFFLISLMENEKMAWDRFFNMSIGVIIGLIILGIIKFFKRDESKNNN